MNKFTHKGYGRIYCETLEDVAKVNAVIREMDNYEFENYMPKNLVAPFSEYPKVVYTHKFSDMDIDEITAKCWAAGTKVWVFDSHHTEYPTLGVI